MKILRFILPAMAVALTSAAQNKSDFDLDDSLLQKANHASISNSTPHFIQNQMTEVSLLPGGYFTIGTSEGVSASQLDDRCSVTYGHPYALTSHPFIAVDGGWQKLDDYFGNARFTNATRNGDTLQIDLEKPGVCAFSFGIISTANDSAVTLQLSIRNLDNAPHRMGLGLMFDPALGRWGDGHLNLQQAIVLRDSLLAGVKVPERFEIWERATGNRGIGIDGSFVETKPSHLIIANWRDVFDDLDKNFSPSLTRALYDLTLKMIWEENALQPNEERRASISFNLLPPEFGSSVFMRWDLPSFLSTETNVLFPRDLPTTVTVANTHSFSITGAQLKGAASYPFTIKNESTQFAIAANDLSYQKLHFESHELYEDQVVPITVECIQNNQHLDALTRNVFVPAVPLSDTGLVITTHDLITSSFPNIELIFGAQVEATGQRLLDLRKENVFLFEDEARIKDFDMAKDSGGGAALADIVFVLDVSGSMGNEINQVRNNIGEFADSLVARGYDYRIGVVTFSTTVDAVWDLTADVEKIRQNLAGIQLWGGVEDSPAALYRATELSLRPGSRRNIIWITDEPYPEHSYTKEEIVNRMLSLDITVHGIGSTNLQTDWFDPIVIPTGGNFYDINGNFRDILLEVSRFELQDRYKISYTSAGADNTSHTIRLEIHYAGLGGSETLEYTPGSFVMQRSALVCYPNPFNPTTKIQISNPNRFSGHVTIYNMLGQRVREMPITSGQSRQELLWNARTDNGLSVSAGLYFINLSLFDAQGILRERQVQRVVFIK